MPSVTRTFDSPTFGESKVTIDGDGDLHFEGLFSSDTVLIPKGSFDAFLAVREQMEELTEDDEPAPRRRTAARK